MKKFLTLFTALTLLGSMTFVQAVAYTPAGEPASVFGSPTWTPSNTDNDMTLSNGLYVFAKKSNFSQTAIQFKVCKDHAWTTAYPGGNYGFDIPAGSKYLIITYNTSGNEVNAFAISSMTVAGDNGTLFGTTWDPSNTANDMVLQDNGTYKFEKNKVALSEGTVKFKACANHGWTDAWPSDNYSLSIPESGNYTITITFNPKTLSVSATADLEEAGVVIPTIAMHGNFTGSWVDTENFTVADNNETASLTLTGVTKGDYLFGVKIDGTWVSNGSAFTRDNNSYVISGSSPNCTFNADRNGDYTFTWTYATNTLAVTYPAVPAQSVAFNSLASQILNGSVINLANCVTSSGIDEPTYRFYIKEKNGEYGDAINANHSFNANGEYVVKVEALEYGEPVASDESNVVVYQSYTFTNGSTIYVDFSNVVDDEKKGVNYPKVDQVGMDWDGEGAGTIKTITFTANVTWTTMAESFIKTEKNGWANLPFTVPGIGKNCAVVAADGASFTWSTHTAPVVTVEAKGEWDGWTDALEFVTDGSGLTATATLAGLPAGNYAFKLIVGGGENWRSNENAFHRFWTSASGITENLDNMELQADADGDYVFTWTFATNALSIAFPENPKEGTNEIQFFAPRTEEHQWDNVYVYAWRRTAGDDVPLTSAWPGDPAAKDGEWYKATIAKGACVIFHDNNGMQSFDIMNVQKDACYIANSIDDSEQVADPEKPIKARFIESCEISYYLTADAGIAGAGEGRAWNAKLEDLKLEGNSITIPDLPAGVYEFKITNGSWAWSLGGKEHLNTSCSNGAATTGNGNVKFKLEDEQDVTISYNPATQKICLDATTVLPFEVVRDGLVEGRFYTFCNNNGMRAVRGASLWSFVSRDDDLAYLVEAEAPYEPGKPYIIYAPESGAMEAILDGSTLTAGTNGALHGTFEQLNQDNLDDLASATGSPIYLLSNNLLWRVTGEGTSSNRLLPGRAYLVYKELPSTGAPSAPGRRILTVALHQDSATGISEVQIDTEKATKVLIDGQLYIKFQGTMYNVQGARVK